MIENDKNVSLIVCDVHTNWHLIFSKMRFQGFISEILRVVGPLGEKFIFLTPLGQPKFPGVLDFLLY